jgi:hypothetical protein
MSTALTVAVLRPDAVLLPRCLGVLPETLCTCGGASLLAYVMGGYRHVAICMRCRDGGPCDAADQHVACTDPKPVRCLHDSGGCGEPITLDAPCAYGLGPCCACCWQNREVTGACR